MSILSFKNVFKSYDKKCILQDVTFDIPSDQILVITGESGCGKTTLLNMMGLLEECDSGEIFFMGKKITELSKKEITQFHRNELGYIFQNYALIDDETVYKNLKLSLKYTNVPRNEQKDKIQEALQIVGLEGYESRFVYQLSGGEQQRIAIARLYLKPCKLVLADEPTGSLDKKNKELIINLIINLKNAGKTVVVVTHDDDFIKIADLHYRFGINL